MNASELFTLFALALAGAGHCAGMCGGFALAATSPTLRRGVWSRLLAYGVGKAVSYVFISMILLVALETAWAARWLSGTRETLGLILAAILIVGGAVQVSRIRWQPAWERWFAGRFGGCGVAGGIGETGLRRAFLVGWLNGLLPCGLSFAAMMLVLRWRSPGPAVAGLTVFALGTLPVLALVVALGSRVSLATRSRWTAYGGWLLMLLGALTALRSMPAGNAWLHATLGAWAGLPPDPWCL